MYRTPRESFISKKVELRKGKGEVTEVGDWRFEVGF